MTKYEKLYLQSYQANSKNMRRLGNSKVASANPFAARSNRAGRANKISKLSNIAKNYQIIIATL